MKKIIIRQLLSAGYALLTASMVGRWAIHYAYYERGYSDVGGEYMLIPLVFYIAYKMFEMFMESLEEDGYESKKK